MGWLVSSGSTLFAKLSILVCKVEKVKSKDPEEILKLDIEYKLSWVSEMYSVLMS